MKNAASFFLGFMEGGGAILAAVVIMCAILVSCSDTLDKKVAESQQQADYCQANPGVCERYCQDFPLEKTCPK